MLGNAHCRSSDPSFSNPVRSAGYARRLAATVSLVALTLACNKQTADDHLLKANAYVEQARFREAVIEYRSALQIDPKRGDIRLKLADVYMRLGELRGALGESVRAADLLPKDVSAQLRAGNLLLRAGSFEDAKGRADAAAALDSKNSEALVLRGNALAGLKDLDGALAEFQEAIALNPTDELAYQSLGVVQRVRGQGAEAEAAFRKRDRGRTDSRVSARMGLANYLWAQGRAPEAEEILKAALALDPANLSTNRALAVFYLASNRQQDAAPYFQTIANTAKTSEALLSLADYYAGMKRYDDSAKVLHEVAARPEANAAAQTRLAAIDAHNGQRAQALAKLRDVIAQHPKEMTARLLVAQLLVADGKSDEALAEATGIVRDEPTASVADAAYLLIGAINAATDRPEDAIKAYEEVLKRDPQSIAANVALSSLQLSTGSLDKATTYAQAALATRPGNALALAMMVRIYLVQGNTAEGQGDAPAARESISQGSARPQSHGGSAIGRTQSGGRPRELQRGRGNFADRHRGNDRTRANRSRGGSHQGCPEPYRCRLENGRSEREFSCARGEDVRLRGSAGEGRGIAEASDRGCACTVAGLSRCWGSFMPPGVASTTPRISSRRSWSGIRSRSLPTRCLG